MKLSIGNGKVTVIGGPPDSRITCKRVPGSTPPGAYSLFANTVFPSPETQTSSSLRPSPSFAIGFRSGTRSTVMPLVAAAYSFSPSGETGTVEGVAPANATGNNQLNGPG